MEHSFLLFSDIDNTLLFNKHLSKNKAIEIKSKTGNSLFLDMSTVELLEELRNIKFMIILISGRKLNSYYQVSKYIPHDMGVIEHGGEIIQKVFNKETNNISQAWKNKHKDTVSTKEFQVGQLWRYRDKLKQAGYLIKDSGRKYSFRVYNLNSSQNLNELQLSLDVDIKSNNYKLKTVQNQDTVDIIPKTSGKLNAAQFITTEILFESDKVYALGDDLNDIDMLDFFKNSYCHKMSHANLLDKMISNSKYISPYTFSDSTIDILSKIKNHCTT